MYIPNPYFKNVPKMGNLEMDYIFLENGYPVLFTCKNQNRIFLCICRTVIDVQKWVISEINVQTLSNLINNVTSIYEAFKSGKNYACIVKWDKVNKQEEYEVLKCSMLSDSDLPKKNVFLDDEGESLEYLNKVKNRILQYYANHIDSLFASKEPNYSSVSQIVVKTVQDDSLERLLNVPVTSYLLNSQFTIKYSSLPLSQKRTHSEAPMNQEYKLNISAA